MSVGLKFSPVQSPWANGSIDKTSKKGDEGSILICRSLQFGESLWIILHTCVVFYNSTRSLPPKWCKHQVVDSTKVVCVYIYIKFNLDWLIGGRWDRLWMRLDQWIRLIQDGWKILFHEKWLDSSLGVCNPVTRRLSPLEEWGWLYHDLTSNFEPFPSQLGECTRLKKTSDLSHQPSTGRFATCGQWETWSFGPSQGAGLL